jgi:uncharacterized membrane protein YoaK (UPF0700 family)
MCDRSGSRVESCRFLPGRDTMVVMLTWAAGAVDAISYLGLGHVFTANMTGNAVLLGFSIGQGHALAALRPIIAMAGFVVGVAVGALIIERSPQSGEWPLGVTHAVSLQWVFLILGIGGWYALAHDDVTIYCLIASSAIAMGMQSVAVRQLKIPGVATTYITGTLTNAVADATGWLCALKYTAPALDAKARTAMRAVSRTGGFPDAAIQALIVIAYVAAAIVTAFLKARRSILETLIPVIAVGLVLLNATALHRRERICKETSNIG